MWGVNIKCVPVGTVVAGADGKPITIDERTMASNGREFVVSQGIYDAIKAATFEKREA